MFKALFAGLNVAGFMLVNLFLVADIGVTQTVPSTIEIGKDYTIEMVVNKADLAGFAQIKLQIPDGLTVSAASQHGSTFKFKDQEARFIWYALPSEESFTITYNLHADEGASGEKNLTGKFSYVVDNNPQTFTIAPASITITGDDENNGTIGDNNGGNDNGTTEVHSNAGIEVTYDRNIEDLGNDEYRVSISIYKNGMTGFARVRESIPEGFSASQDEALGSIFTSVDKSVKFIWTQIPAEGTFTISYLLKADPSVTTGDYAVNGEFSYLINEETAVKVADPTTVHIERVVATIPDPIDTDPIDEAPTPPANITCDRTVESESDVRFKVSLTINKSDVQGFARIKETIPAGFTAVKGNTQGANFSSDDGDARFLWTALPSDEEMTVTYYLEAGSAISGDFTLEGEFSYVLNEATVAESCGTTPFTVTPIVVEVPETTDTGNDGGSENGSNNGGSENGGNDANTANNATGNDNGSENGTSTTVPDPETGVTYRIQILAAHKNVDQDYFRKKYGFRENVMQENQGGWEKYTIGGFSAYTKARDKREDLNSYDFPGPFVAAYNDGNRISVQEALMLSNQQWVQ